MKSLSLMTLSTLVLSSFTRRTGADVPDVQTIEDLTTCPKACKIRVYIRHANPSGTHYIDKVEVEVDGQITEYTLEHQDTDPFTVDLNLENTQRRNPYVKSRAHCTLHGWGDWSNQVQLPEFPSAALAVFGALIASLFILRKSSKRSQRIHE